MFGYQDIILLGLCGFMLLQMLGFSVFLKMHKLSIGGVSPISPILFKMAKVAMFLCWVSLLIQALGVYNLSISYKSNILGVIAVFVWGIGVVIQLMAYLNLGENLKFGIPNKQEQENATLKVNGVYSISRNPMYLGFYLMTLASCIYVLNPIVWALALFTIIVHHSIVLKEEDFLKESFGKKWEDYRHKVWRYI